jgi:hypothetical protein
MRVEALLANDFASDIISESPHFDPSLVVRAGTEDRSSNRSHQPPDIAGSVPPRQQVC